jgi:long-chain acyl-CoA synthetase
MSYTEAHATSTHFGKGLRALGQLPRTPIAIYAETRAEWLMSAMGAFSQSIYVATLYTNLGDEAIVHGLNETEVREVAIINLKQIKYRKIRKLI